MFRHWRYFNMGYSLVDVWRGGCQAVIRRTQTINGTIRDYFTLDTATKVLCGYTFNRHQSMDDWYNVTQRGHLPEWRKRDFLLVQRFSFKSALQTVYPQHNWRMKVQNKPSQLWNNNDDSQQAYFLVTLRHRVWMEHKRGFWRTDNREQFFDWLLQLGHEIYGWLVQRLPESIYKENGGKGLLAYYLVILLQKHSERVSSNTVDCRRFRKKQDFKQMLVV